LFRLAIRPTRPACADEPHQTTPGEDSAVRNIIALLFFSAAVGLIITTWAGLSEGYRTRDWPTTSATVVEATYTHHTHRCGRLPCGDSFTDVVIFYTVDGQEVRWEGRLGQDVRWEGPLDREWHKGQTIQIKYDPNHPEQMVTLRDAHSSTTSLPGLAKVTMGAWAVMLLLGAGYLIARLVERRQQADAPTLADTLRAVRASQPGPPSQQTAYQSAPYPPSTAYPPVRQPQPYQQGPGPQQQPSTQVPPPPNPSIG
jgi:hypothetical protein